MRRLFAAVTPDRKIAYLTLLYTGQRRSEIAALRVGDLSLDGEEPFVLIRAETTKDKDKRAVPLHPRLVAELRKCIPATVRPGELVFPRFPNYDALMTDLARAGIERRDEMGRSVHFHSFRKTWQTMGVRAGVSQRVAQDVLGHSDPVLTANAYTDMPAVGMHAELRKIPWIEEHAQLDAQKTGKTGSFSRFQGLLAELMKLTKSLSALGITDAEAANVMAAQAGIEPATK